MAAPMFLRIKRSIHHIKQWIYKVCTFYEHFNLDLYVEINQYHNEQRYQIFLGKKHLADIDELDYERLLKLCHCHLIYCITEYNCNVSSLTFRISITWHISEFIYFCIILHRLLYLIIYLYVGKVSYNSL
jgi:hypothetical protein